MYAESYETPCIIQRLVESIDLEVSVIVMDVGD